MAKLLLVEDDIEFATAVSEHLAPEFVFDISHTAGDALEYAKSYTYELIIVDFQLPDRSGPQLIKDLRQRGIHTPVLMLTARATIDDKEVGFTSGCDDYLVKSASPEELCLRINALLRRPSINSNPLITVGSVTLDTNNHRVLKQGREIRLLPKDYSLLEYMARHRDRIFSAQELLDRLWDADSTATAHAVQACINRLRSKLDDSDKASIIQTRYKLGYLIASDISE